MGSRGLLPRIWRSQELSAGLTGRTRDGTAADHLLYAGNNLAKVEDKHRPRIRLTIRENDVPRADTGRSKIPGTALL